MSTSVPYQPGATVNMEFTLPQAEQSGSTLNVVGRVTRLATGFGTRGPQEQQRPMGVGVRFVVMNEEERQALAEFTEKHGRPTPTA